MTMFLILMLLLQGLTLWRIRNMSKNTDAADALDASLARLEATQTSTINLIDKLAGMVAVGDDVSERINTASAAVDKANEALDMVVTGNQPPAA